jgi:hypothetical protein
MELNLARLVYEQVDPTVKDSRTVPHLQQVSISLPNSLATSKNPNLTAIERAINAEGFLVQVVA